MATIAALPPPPRPSSASATMVSLPPPPPTRPPLPLTGASDENNNPKSTTLTTTTTTTTTMDPESLLDALDSFNATTSASAAGRYHAAASSSAQPDQSQHQQQQQRDFDPVEFLNQHYHTEQQLVSALPALRSAISSRLDRLDESLSTTLRHQAALAPSLARDVVHARNAVLRLTQRIHQVRAQARKSEEAVLEITRDMKRLDHAKRHLQRTITALKRLHMLLHAAEQLRMAAMVADGQPIPRYRAAAHLVDATRLLLGHFEGYMNSVPKMRQVRDAVGVIKGQLWEGIVGLFREAGGQHEEGGTGGDDIDDGGGGPSSAMVQSTLADACLVIEALGPKSKERFISDFVKDHLREYEELYNPMGATKKSGGGGGGGGSATPSFKKDDAGRDAGGSGGRVAHPPSGSSLDAVENRFAWYRTKLRSLQLRFARVFPPHWNVHYRLTASFLGTTARHLKFVLRRQQARTTGAGVAPAPSSGGVDASALASSIAGASAKFGSSSAHGGLGRSSTHGGGASSSPEEGGGGDEGERAVSSLLKALQKTILFEKETSAWLSRDFGTRFADPGATSGGSDGVGVGVGRGGGGENKESDGGDGDNDLEFDDRGRAVPAKSAEGIRIKYERRKRAAAAEGGGGAIDVGGPDSSSSGAGPVPPLAGIASSVFDDHMTPYVALEERSMDEQLKAASSDDTVDARGERPVFVSSTNLFIYMKNSMLRCTALTREKTFFLLQRSFQKKLRDYAKVMEKKLPPPLGQGVAKLALVGAGVGASSSAQAGGGAAYRIPPGEEVTVCHVINTCEYCADTVEALEDLIRDKIGDKYKNKIDMSEEQGAFQDVTAKSLRVLVSGLEQRLDATMKDISRTNWSTFDMVGEESGYVRLTHLTVQPFVVKVRELIPSSYFRSFCDKFAMAFASAYYRTLVGLKRISEAGTQQLLLDVYSIKTLLLKLPVMESERKTALGSGGGHHHGNANLSGGSTIAPAMYTKMVNKEFRKLEVMLKLVGGPREMLVEMFRVQWDCSMDTAAMASDFAMIMTLKGIPRTDHASMLETLGVEAGEDGGGADSSTMTANIQALQERGSDVAAKVNADLNQMRQRVDDFRKAFR